MLFFPNTYEVIGAVHRRGRDRGRQGPGRPPRRHPADHGDGHVACPTSRTTRTASRSPSPCRSPGARRRWSSELKEILVSHPGDAEVHVHLQNGSRTTVLRLGGVRVAPTPALRADLKTILGPSAVGWADGGSGGSWQDREGEPELRSRPPYAGRPPVPTPRRRPVRPPAGRRWLPDAGPRAGRDGVRSPGAVAGGVLCSACRSACSGPGRAGRAGDQRRARPASWSTTRRRRSTSPRTAGSPLLGFGFGVVVAVVAWLVLRRVPRTLRCWLGGDARLPAACRWSRGRCGRLIGLSAYRATGARRPRQGATFAAPPDLHAYGSCWCPAFAAVIVLTLLAGWSNDPDLRPSRAPLPGLRPRPGAAGTRRCSVRAGRAGQIRQRDRHRPDLASSPPRG